MNFIGSKERLVQPLILRAMADLETPRTAWCGMVFGDGFAGTGSVSAAMQAQGWHVRAADMLAFSAMVTVAMTATVSPDFARGPAPGHWPTVEHLRRIARDASGDAKWDRHWFVDTYCQDGSAGRLYFGRENGRAIAAMREAVETWELTARERCYAIAMIVRAADTVANVATVFVSYLKKLKRQALRPIDTAVMPFAPNAGRSPAVVTQAKLEWFLVANAGGIDVLYLDPPYNARQYAPNYHLLETIARWDHPTAEGITGQRPWHLDQRSHWCGMKSALPELKRTLAASDAPVVMLSYSSDGIMSDAQIREAMGRHGAVRRYDHAYARLRTDRDDAENRTYKEGALVEYVYVLTRA